MKNYSILLLCLIFLTATSQGQNSTAITINCDKSVAIFNDSISQHVRQVIDQHAHESLADSVIDALSIGVYMNNVSFTEHYGELDRGKDNRPDDKTIYEIASVTKTFTGTLAAQAVSEGKIKLDDDIRIYLPKEYDFSNLQFKSESIQIKHLLTHTSGLPANNKGFENIPDGLSESERAQVYYKNEKRQTKAMFFKHLSEITIDTLPGTVFNYSNFGTNLMAFILKKAYEKDFQQLIQTEVIGKIGMPDTKFKLSKTEQKRLANGYIGSGEQVPQLPLAHTLWGAEGALKSTVPDMLKYIQFQIDLENAIAQEAHRKLYEIDTDYWIGYFWWIIENMDHDLHYRHDGGALGTRNILLIYPEANIGISIFTNKATDGVFENLSKLGRAIYDDLKK